MIEKLPSNSLETASQFRELQTQLRQRWQVVEQFDLENNDILVVPSLSLDQQQLTKIEGVHHYEERQLFSLIRLRNPRTRLIYVTSEPLHPSIIDYYLQLLPGIPFSHARERLLLFSTYDPSQHCLTQKILDRPRLIARMQEALQPNRSYMICFNSTTLERELSVKLGIPLWASDPDLAYWGSKSGSRQIFAECGVPHPDGSDLVWTVDDLVIVAAELWQRHPQLKRMVVKLNEGFSGEGNALLDLPQCGSISLSEREAIIRARFPHLRFQGIEETWEIFQQRIPELGVIVEVFIEGKIKRSPSVQGRILPTGDVEILSTHDQILGGPDEQVYLGGQFPADQAYRLPLQAWGLRIGKNLAEKQALERFGIDFIVVKDETKSEFPWAIYAIEINLRKGGTTHPFMTLKYLTSGRYDTQTGLFYSQQGQPKFYKATDNLQKPQYRGLLPNDFMDIIADHQLHFDTSTETGTVFHLMGCLSQFGKIGLTSIGNSPEEAESIYQKVVTALDAETENWHPGKFVPLGNTWTWNSRGWS